MALVCQGLDDRFTKQEQYLEESFVDLVMATVNGLADQIGWPQVNRWVSFAWIPPHRLRHSFDTLYNHFYIYYPRPSDAFVVG